MAEAGLPDYSLCAYCGADEATEEAIRKHIRDVHVIELGTRDAQKVRGTIGYGFSDNMDLLD